MANPVYVTTLTLMDGSTVKIPSNHITSYSSQYTYPTPGGAAVFKQSIVMLTDNREIAVQEDAAAITLAIKNQVDVTL